MKPTALAAVALVATLVPAGVWAQESGAPRPASERRPFRGIFGGLSTPRTPQSLVLSGALFGAYDDNVLAGLAENNPIDWRVQRSGAYGGAYAGLDFRLSRTSRRVSFGAGAGSRLRYYRSGDLSNWSPDYHATADVGFALTRTTLLGIGQRADYSRFYRYSMLPPSEVDGGPGAILSEDPAFDITGLAAFRHSTQVSISQSVGRYASLTGAYHLGLVNFRDDDFAGAPDDESAERQLLDQRIQAVSAGFHYARPLTAHATLNLGYGLRMSDARRGSGEARTRHDVNAGIGYARALSFSRRTSLSFSSGSSIVVGDELGEQETGPRTHVRLTGNVALTRELGRTWTARTAYFRGLVFREGFDEPFFTDGFTAGLGGLITRRLSFAADGAWTLSTLQRRGQTGHTGFRGLAHTTYALHNLVALFASYSYYKYSFDPDVPLDPRLPRALDRQGVQAGITAAVPLFR